MRDKSYKRHIAKTITWRFIGTIDTIILSWFITGDPYAGLKIGLAEITTKSILYYLHERVWFKINLSKEGVTLESRKRHLAKTVTWRIVGTLDTMTLAWIISGNPLAALQIGLAEIITKMVFYYLHERAWYRVDYGLRDRNKTL
ncbi:DUF2061 domain-containing protein [Oceanihabitans sediminis]|uniref:DUF2061 domain-containing protein n=1 Tax=Oceanihabitans sediminis TaxID=1812012 RepID=UPI003A946937